MRCLNCVLVVMAAFAIVGAALVWGAPGLKQ